VLYKRKQPSLDEDLPVFTSHLSRTSTSKRKVPWRTINDAADVREESPSPPAVRAEFKFLKVEVCQLLKPTIYSFQGLCKTQD